MIKNELERLGAIISRLRIAKQLKQSELAYEAGISERTLQRIEAGDVVKSDGLLRVLGYLGKLDELFSAIDTATLSPYELINQVNEKKPRSRVRTTKADNKKGAAPTKAIAGEPGKILWPEDQS